MKTGVRILECSTAGFKPLSALVAKVTMYGKYYTIENHYQNPKTFKNGSHNLGSLAKGKIPVFITLNNKKYDVKYLTSWYYFLC